MTQAAPLLVNAELVRGLREIQNKSISGAAARARLGELLQSALQLEFATVPVYLSSAYSFRSAGHVSDLISRIAKEEMLHMAVVANLMNAIGVRPDIAGAAPAFPFELDVLSPPLQLNLGSFTLEQIEQLFMRVETPEDPVDFPPIEFDAPAKPETIGHFYEEIIDIVDSDLIPGLFENAERDAYRQLDVLPNFQPVPYRSDEDERRYPLPAGFDLMVTDVASAVANLRWVVAGGEGANPFDPLDAEGLPGHYYRFESILEQKYLLPDEEQELGFSYSGGTLVPDLADVHEFDLNARFEDYQAHPRVQRQMRRFNRSYSEMIDLLQVAFNCPSPEDLPEAKAAYDRSIGIMRALPNAASAILRSAAREGVKAGIPFQYTPTVATP